ncbi:MAG TPA: glycoside hydrolase family 16 protein [Sphingomicrobium sp.]|nr:glycoside hydrolase family 16 protein [Sphingomicrobium sp.]
MSLAHLLLVASAFTVTNSTYRGPVNRPAHARLVWHDEFSGSALDLTKWQYDTSRNKQGWHNGERQYYSAGRTQNIRVRNGLLTITARHEKLNPKRYPDWGGQEYTSAKILSKGAGWTYGFYEVRAKLPCARGMWPAIWMLPVRMAKWPDDGEIDIMEQVGAEPNLVYASLHTKLFNHILKTQRSAQKLVPTSCSAFHVYQLDWRPDSIVIGVDGRGILRVQDDWPGNKGAWPFFTPFEMILNLAVGGDWAGAKGIDDAAMPQRMQVDYVRVWQVPSGSGR